MVQKDKGGHLPACGLCLCGAHEVDQLVQMGQMGYICLCCLQQVADTMLPPTVKLCGNSQPQKPGLAGQAGNVVQLVSCRLRRLDAD